GQGDGGHQSQQLLRGIRAGCQPPGFAQVGGEEADQAVGQPWDQLLFEIPAIHRSASRLGVFRWGWSRARILKRCKSGCRSACLTFLLVYSVKAAVRASASRPLKNTRYLGGVLLLSFLMA